MEEKSETKKGLLRVKRERKRLYWKVNEKSWLQISNLDKQIFVCEDICQKVSYKSIWNSY